jgi:hypothetical protein
MSEDKTKGEIAPSTNTEERPDLQNYKSKDKGSTSTSKHLDVSKETTNEGSDCQKIIVYTC